MVGGSFKKRFTGTPEQPLWRWLIREAVICSSSTWLHRRRGRREKLWNRGSKLQLTSIVANVQFGGGKRRKACRSAAANIKNRIQFSRTHTRLTSGAGVARGSSSGRHSMHQIQNPLV